MDNPSPASTGKSEKLGMVFLFLFLTPFCIVGIVTAFLTASALLAGDYGKGAFLGIFALVFGGFGFGLMTSLIVGRSKVKNELALKSAHPSEPWMWREDWAEGLSRSTIRNMMFFAWGFAVMWNLIAAPLLVILPAEVLDKGNHAALLGLLFPIVGLGLLVWAVRETLEWKKFGQSVFRMTTLLGVIGGELNGTIAIPASFDPAQDFDLALSCINRRRTGSGSSSSTTETILWEEKQTAVHSLAESGPMGSGLQVHFEIPYNNQQSNYSIPNNVILWRLGAHASVPGVDYMASFEIPVFKTSASKAPVMAREEEPELPVSYQPSGDAGISIGVGPTGGTEFVVKPEPSAGAIIPLFAFFLAWTGIVAVLISLGTSVIFPVMFGAFDILFLFILLQLMFGQCRIVIQAGSISISNSVGLFSTSLTAPASDIQEIKPSMAMQSGHTVRYSVKLTRRGGKESALWVTMKEKHDAEWLAAELRKQVGLSH